MAYQHVKVERNGPITTIILNRPDVMNALHSEAHFELHEVFNDFSARDVQAPEMASGFGPQRSKNFANAMSSEVVAFSPFRDRLGQGARAAVEKVE